MSNSSVIKISPIGFKILKALSEYRFLTTRQILAMGIAKDRGYLGQVLTSLLSVPRRVTTDQPKSKNFVERKPKEIGELDFGVKVGKGRLPRMYYLTKRGATLLETLDPELAPVRFPNRVVRFAPDYEHRVSCVDFHIALNAWAAKTGQAVINYRHYFDWSTASSKGRPQPATRINLAHKRVDGDAIFLLRDPSGIERSFIYEMANGVDTGRVLDKMQHLAHAIEDRSLNKGILFPADKAVRILFVFEHLRTAKLVATRAATFRPLANLRDHFFLQTLEDLTAPTLADHWMSLDLHLTPKPLF